MILVLLPCLPWAGDVCGYKSFCARQGGADDSAPLQTEENSGAVDADGPREKRKRRTKIRSARRRQKGGDAEDLGDQPSDMISDGHGTSDTHVSSSADAPDTLMSSEISSTPSKKLHALPADRYPKKGKFTKSETEAIREAVYNYCFMHNITVDTLICGSNHSRDHYGAWVQIGMR